MPSGCFYGLARHFSGAEVAVLYQVLHQAGVITTISKITLLGETNRAERLHSCPLCLGYKVKCLWMGKRWEDWGPTCRDTDEAGKTTLGLSLGTTFEGEEPAQPATPTLTTLTSGPYAAKYGTLDQLGQVGRHGWSSTTLHVLPGSLW